MCRSTGRTCRRRWQRRSRGRTWGRRVRQGQRVLREQAVPQGQPRLRSRAVPCPAGAAGRSGRPKLVVLSVSAAVRDGGGGPGRTGGRSRMGRRGRAAFHRRLSAEVCAAGMAGKPPAGSGLSGGKRRGDMIDADGRHSKKDRLPVFQSGEPVLCFAKMVREKCFG